MVTKMRTIRQFFIQSIFDQTVLNIIRHVTGSALRRLVAEKRIDATCIGSKVSLDVDEVLSFFTRRP